MIVGAGHSGLTMSACLRESGIAHVVFERGRIGNAWHVERWASLQLLTPNWQNGFRGFPYDGSDPDGFMTAGELAERIDTYAAQIDAPVVDQCEVGLVARVGDHYEIETSQGHWRALAVVLAIGACNRPAVPSMDTHVREQLPTFTPFDYDTPGTLPKGPVLVVGASATGTQLAAEIHASGRPVTISVGEHVRMPRLYRGRDIQWWLDATGLLDETWLEIEDLERARHVPSPQILGNNEGLALDLNSLSDSGVELVGRCVGFGQANFQFSGSLKNNCKLADLKMNRLLNTIDDWVSEVGRDAEFPPAHRFTDTVVPDNPPLLKSARSFGSVVWATGFKPDFSWLDMGEVFDRKGRLRHEGGVVAPGLFVLGLTFLRRRKSSFIVGAQDDCEGLTQELMSYLSS